MPKWTYICLALPNQGDIESNFISMVWLCQENLTNIFKTIKLFLTFFKRLFGYENFRNSKKNKIRGQIIIFKSILEWAENFQPILNDGASKSNLWLRKVKTTFKRVFKYHFLLHPDSSSVSSSCIKIS